MKLQPSGVPVDGGRAGHSKDSVTSCRSSFPRDVCVRIRVWVCVLRISASDGIPFNWSDRQVEGTLANTPSGYKKPLPLISSGRQSSQRVSKRSFLVIGEYSPEFNEITYTFTIKDWHCTISRKSHGSAGLHCCYSLFSPPSQASEDRFSRKWRFPCKRYPDNRASVFQLKRLTYKLDLASDLRNCVDTARKKRTQ